MYREQDEEEMKDIRTIQNMQYLEDLLNACKECSKCGDRFFETGDELYCEVCQSNPQKAQYL